MAASRITELIDQAEQCHREVALEYYKAYSGRQDTLDIAVAMARYPELYRQDTYDFIAALGDEQVPDARLRRFLLIAFTSFQLQEAQRPTAEELANRESAIAVELEGREVPFRALHGLMANEHDTQRRRKLDALQLEVVRELNPLRREIFEISQQTVEKLGYKSMLELQRQLQGFEPLKLAEEGRRFLDATEAIYEEQLGFYCGIAGVPRERLSHSDISRVMRAARFDPLFPADRLVPALERTLAGLGIDLERQRNVTLDLEQRPRKSPRAFCIAIDAPRDVRLVLSPRGGQDDYAVLFHEAGHLEFSAHMRPELSYLYRQHGDLSVHEGYAFLLQHLTHDPAWWSDVMRADPGEYPAFARFQRLYMLRRYFAKLNYEVEFYQRGGGPELEEAYQRWLELGCRCAYSPERYLYDLDEGLYVLQYLQAWIWEAQLRRLLQQEFGEAWFTRRSAGELLRELWADGMKYSVAELASRLGIGPLDLGVVQQELIG